MMFLHIVVTDMRKALDKLEESIKILGEMDYRFHAAHLDRGLTIHEAVPGGFNRAGEGL